MRAKFIFEAKNKDSKYYAPDYLIQELMDAVNKYVPLHEIDHIVEPAAGDGALIPFIDKLANAYNIDTSYYDLKPDPGNPRIKQQNFLDYSPEPYYSPSRLVLTGPPYGEPGATAKLWKQFAQKASEVAGYVAFISPVTWLDVKHPVPHLELIYQKDMGWVKFRGSEAFGGEDAWWNNLSYYKDGYNAWKYERMRYPGKAAWNGEGPIQRAINNTFIKKSNIEEELKEIEAKLSGEQGETELMNDKDVYIPGVSEYDPDLDYKYAMTHPGYKGPPGGPYTNYYNDLD